MENETILLLFFLVALFSDPAVFAAVLCLVLVAGYSLIRLIIKRL